MTKNILATKGRSTKARVLIALIGVIAVLACGFGAVGISNWYHAHRIAGCEQNKTAVRTDMLYVQAEYSFFSQERNLNNTYYAGWFKRYLASGHDGSLQLNQDVGVLPDSCGGLEKSDVSDLESLSSDPIIAVNQKTISTMTDLVSRLTGKTLHASYTSPPSGECLSDYKASTKSYQSLRAALDLMKSTSSFDRANAKTLYSDAVSTLSKNTSNSSYVENCFTSPDLSDERVDQLLSVPQSKIDTPWLQFMAHVIALNYQVVHG